MDLSLATLPSAAMTTSLATAASSCHRLRRKLDLRYSPVVILVEFGKLRRVLHRQRQCRLQTARAWANSEAA